MIKNDSIWSVDIKSWFSWNMKKKKLLQLSDLAQSFIVWRNDRACWSLSGGKIRLRYNHAPWSKFLLTSPSIPKHKFVAWMALNDRLPTLQKISSWVLLSGANCVLWLLFFLASVVYCPNLVRPS